MAMENPPFEDVFPIQDRDFPLLCLFTWGYMFKKTGGSSCFTFLIPLKLRVCESRDELQLIGLSFRMLQTPNEHIVEACSQTLYTIRSMYGILSTYIQVTVLVNLWENIPVPWIHPMKYAQKNPSQLDPEGIFLVTSSFRRDTFLGIGGGWSPP